MGRMRDRIDNHRSDVGFQDHLRQISQQFTPMQGLQDQLDVLAEAFRDNVMNLARALEPATTFQDQLAHLVSLFEPARTLHSQFTELSHAFGNSPQPSNNGA
jgi:hypothetical protein